MLMESIWARQTHIDNISEEARSLMKNVLIKFEDMKETTIHQSHLNKEIGAIRDKFYRE